MESPCPRDQVMVTLTAVNPTPDFAFPTRHLLLGPDQSILLGRMSKKNASFTATEQNGWIDSAVMSRSHASLTFDKQHRAVFIRDVGSLHGTFYNDTRLKRSQIQAVKTGDHIRFGIPVDRVSDTCPPCVMQVAVQQLGPQSSFQAPIIFRVPDDTDEEESAEEDHGDSTIRHGLQVLRNNNIRPAKNCITREPVITIDISDHEMGSPEPEDQTVSTRSIQDHMTDRAVSDKSHSRMPSPSGTVDIPDYISDDEAVFYEDEYEEEYMSESDGESHGQSMLQDPLDHTQRRTLYGSDQHVPHIEVTEAHETEMFHRYQNDCLPPIISFPVASADSVPKQPLPGVQLPSLLDTFRSQEIAASYNNTTWNHTNETNTPNQSFVTVPPAPEPAESTLWPVDVAQSRATESSVLLDTGAEFLNSPLKEHHDINMRPEGIPLELDESSAYQFGLTKTIIQQQRQKQQQIQQIQDQKQAQHQQQQSQSQAQAELGGVYASDDHLIGSPKKVVQNKRKALEISEMTDQEIPFAELNPAQDSSSPSAKPKSLDDSTMDTSPVDVHSGAEEPQVKRLRKAAEIFGYAALGGVAVMSALIATAPTL